MIAEPVRSAAVTVIIVNWNAGVQLEKCIESVFESRRENFELHAVIVVDNASLDDSAGNIERRWGERVRVIRNDSNTGFGRACNLGASRSDSEWLLFLNPDARLREDSLCMVMRQLLAERDNERIAVCGIRLVDDNGKTARTCARIPTWRRFIVAAIGLDRLTRGAISGYIMRDWTHDTTQRVDHVIGAFYLVRRTVFEMLGGFDERFFLYLEDLDLSKRIRTAGYEILYCSEASAFHSGGGTSKAIPARRLYYALRSRLQFCRKHFSAAGTLAVSAVTLAVEPVIRLARAILAGDVREVSNVLRAYRMLYRSVRR